MLIARTRDPGRPRICDEVSHEPPCSLRLLGPQQTSSGIPMVRMTTLEAPLEVPTATSDPEAHDMRQHRELELATIVRLDAGWVMEARKPLLVPLRFCRPHPDPGPLATRDGVALSALPNSTLHLLWLPEGRPSGEVPSVFYLRQVSSGGVVVGSAHPDAPLALPPLDPPLRLVVRPYPTGEDGLPVGRLGHQQVLLLQTLEDWADLEPPCLEILRLDAGTILAFPEGGGDWWVLVSTAMRLTLGTTLAVSRPHLARQVRRQVLLENGPSLSGSAMQLRPSPCHSAPHIELFVSLGVQIFTLSRILVVPRDRALMHLLHRFSIPPSHRLLLRDEGGTILTQGLERFLLQYHPEAEVPSLFAVVVSEADYQEAHRHIPRIEPFVP